MEKLRRIAPPALFGLYLAALLVITVIRPGTEKICFFGGSLHLTLLADYLPILHNSVPWFIYLFVGNIVWFIPLGLYLTLFRARTVGRAVLCGFLLSLFIEVMQFVLGTGITETDDLLLNTLGALLGAAIGLALRRVTRRNRGNNVM